MKKIIDAMKAFFEKQPLLSSIVITTVKTFLIAGAVAILLFLGLWIADLYPRLEAALDLKYNAYAIVVPLCIFAALFLLCLMTGILMFFHKYKRSKTKSAFYHALAPIWNKKGHNK